MTSNSIQRSLAEIIAIIVIASTIGISWNFRLLQNAWQGLPAITTPPPTSAPGMEALPLPLGLMQVKELYDRKEIIIVDAREGKSYAEGHISGAISLPLADIDQQLSGFTKGVPPGAMIVVYCNGFDCHDSMTLGKRLLQGGFQQVYIFEGGYPEWRDAGYPVQVKKP
jgi:rhodanese-related sulfurtransferase